MRPGKVAIREFEYIRHGTQTLIANLNIATGGSPELMVISLSS